MPAPVIALAALLVALQGPVGSDSDGPIDSDAVVDGVNAVIADNPTNGFSFTGIDECPFGDVVALATTLQPLLPLDPALLGGRVEAWSVPSASQPHFHCSIESTSAQQLKPPGIAHLEIYAKLLRDQPYVGPDWNPAWIRGDESRRPYRGGTVAVVCLTNDQQWAARQRHCMAHFVDETAGLSIEFEIWSYDGSATAAYARTTFEMLLPTVVDALLAYPTAGD